ncbi:MAG: DUF1501 domain-containing protein [Gemmataceae bacterium]|nr:DUF1501 domain-containing protein [Gemmataceae bacterium]
MAIPSRSGCDDFRRSRPSRRAFLTLGALGVAGLTLSELLRAEAGTPSTRRRARARSCILLHQFGGPSHLDTFDPKPDAPAGIRGPFAVIPTAVPGLRFSEHLPRLARAADRFALVRSVSHRTSSHNSAGYYSLTGHQPLIDIVTANAAATDVPAYGSVLSYLQGAPGGRRVPTFVALPTMIADGPFRTPGEFAGLLGKAHDPLFITSDPNSPSFSARDLTLPEGVSVERAADRDSMLRQLEGLSRLAETAAVRGLSAHRARALSLLTSRETQQALDIQREPARVRDRYGRTMYGQSCLLARRLVEAGVRFVTVYYAAGIGGWDTHRDNFTTLSTSRLPNTDVAVSALLADLHERGLLDETLVIWMGEFGRTPRINATSGRDHWPQCYTVLLAGGGVRSGMAHGSSDASGAFPRDNPLRPDDISATLFAAVGLDPATEIRDQLGRPFPISRGEPIEALFTG